MNVIITQTLQPGVNVGINLEVLERVLKGEDTGPCLEIKCGHILTRVKSGRRHHYAGHFVHGDPQAQFGQYGQSGRIVDVNLHTCLHLINFPAHLAAVN